MKNENLPNSNVMIQEKRKWNLNDIINMVMWNSLLIGLLAGLGYIMLLVD